MADHDDGQFAGRLGELDEETFAAFVAALWAARGFAVERHGPRIEARRDGRTTALFAVAADGPVPDDAPAHVVVGATPPAEPTGGDDVASEASGGTGGTGEVGGTDEMGETGEAGGTGGTGTVGEHCGSGRPDPDGQTEAVRLGPADLRRLVLYAVGRDAGERLLADHLGLAAADLLDGSPDPAGAGGPEGDADLGDSRSGSAGRVRGSGGGPPVGAAGQQRIPAPEDEGSEGDRPGRDTVRGPEPARPEDREGAATGRESRPEGGSRTWTPHVGGEATGDADAEPADGTAGTGRSPDGRRSVAVAVALLVVLGGVVGAAAFAEGGSGGLLGGRAGTGPTDAPDDGGSDVSGTASPDGEASGAEGDDGEVGTTAGGTNGAAASDGTSPTDTRGSNVSVETYPPGVGPEGVTSPTRLGTAHERTLSGTSYRMTVTYREYDDGEQLGYRRQTLTVGGLTLYRADVETVGRFASGRRLVNDVELYADGNVTYFRNPVRGRVSYSVQNAFLVLETDGSRAAQVGRLVEGFARAESTRVSDAFRRENRSYVWLRLDGVAFGLGTEATGSMLVDDRGVVHELRYRYRPEQTSVTAEFVIRYEEFGNVTVEPPPWYEKARNETREDLNETG